MADETIQDRIKLVLTRDAMVQMKPDEIESTASLINDIGLDSIQVLEFVVGLEEEFGISLEDEELSVELFENVNSIAQFIERKIAGETVKPFGSQPTEHLE
ncbi:acyl carrier protein [Verrucomicrobiota bacterium]